MARRRDPDDESSDPNDSGDSGSSSTRPHRERRRPPASHPRRATPVRRWKSTDEAGEEEEDDDEEFDSARGRKGLFHREDHPVYWRARDSLYFEPLVALAIIVIMLVSLYAYTGNWPPVYVVESESMQHGTDDVLGLINTGDLVLAQRIPTDQITPYVTGLQTQYSTYGEYGDVLLYSPDGQGGTPIIHRAILYLQWDPVISGYNATELSGLRCGSDSGAIYSTPGTPNSCGVTGLTGTLELFHIGWRSVNVSIDLSSPELGGHSGYLTMGDNNLEPEGCTTNCVSGLPDQSAGLSELVEPGWIVGVARGMLPWFGAVKLVLEGNAGMVPPQSWQFLGITIVGLILLAFGIHYAFRAEGIEDQRRKDQEAEEAASRPAEDPADSGGDGRGRRFLRALRPWGRNSPSDEEDELTPPRRTVAPARPTGSRRGRPSPKVRRSEKSKRKAPDEDDDDL